MEMRIDFFPPKSPVNDKTCNGKQDVISNYTKKVLKIQKLAPFMAFKKKKGINLCYHWCNSVKFHFLFK